MKTVAVAEPTFLGGLKAFGSGFMCMLREIGDENGYHRWLAEMQLPHSGENWRTYCDDRFAKKMKNPKCC
jgi:hypothetical protein